MKPDGKSNPESKTEKRNKKHIQTFKSETNGKSL
jgi:hypothetical protein